MTKFPDGPGMVLFNVQLILWSTRASTTFYWLNLTAVYIFKSFAVSLSSVAIGMLYYKTAENDKKVTKT